MTDDEVGDLRAVLGMLDPLTRDNLRRVLIHVRARCIIPGYAAKVGTLKA